jgi:hypothetical protein
MGAEGGALEAEKDFLFFRGFRKDKTFSQRFISLCLARAPHRSCWVSNVTADVFTR